MRHDTEQRNSRYAHQVDKAFKAATGVSYSFIRADLESSALAPRLEEAIHHDLDPADFAERVRNQFGLKFTDEADAVPVNRRIAALAAFTAENPEWTFSRSGSIYREGPNGIERLSPGRRPEDKKFGFAVDVSADGVIEINDREVVGLTGDFEFVTGALDIGDAVERMERRYDRGMTM